MGDELDDKTLEEEESDYIPIDPNEIIDTDMLDSKRPAKTFRSFDDLNIDKENTEGSKKKIIKKEPNEMFRDNRNLENSQGKVDTTKFIN
jgi:hypothetical protein